MTISALLDELQALGVVLTVAGDKLSYKAPKDAMTPALRAALKEHKATVIDLLTLPTPACPGPELEALRKEIGELARAEEAMWELSDELDPNWPPSSGVRKRIRRKEAPLWRAIA